CAIDGYYNYYAMDYW
nr:immunoglobulin heavy chain junction region [Mus musculus]NSM06618.1 immunoglobulin heavy chain junction region [Mus musculus]NSM07652.1 immunoglobulin heavy chain junction region [Mus musculus]